MTRTLKIDRELRSLLPPLAKERRALLKKQIEEEGCHDAIKVWEGEDIIVDGHHRYEICNELGYDFAVQELPFADKAAIAEWMVNFQDGRRNWTPAAASAARGLAYNMRKNPPPESMGHVDPQGSVAAGIAQETGVSMSTVKRDGRFQEALSKLASKTREAILAGEVRKPSVKVLSRLNEYDAPSQLAIVASVKSGAFATVAAALDAEEAVPEPVEEDSYQTTAELALKNGKALSTIVGILQKAKRECKAIEEQPGLEIFVSKEKSIQRDIDAAIGAIQATIPHAVCPRCNGDCCVQCGNHGWVNKTLLKSLEESGE